MERRVVREATSEGERRGEPEGLGVELRRGDLDVERRAEREETRERERGGEPEGLEVELRWGD